MTTKPFLSLAAITGAIEPDMMERFIRSFAPAVDEIVIVEACGNQDASHAVTRASDICQDLRLPIVIGKYLNKPGHEDWPHVDDFAAARNLAWSLASGEFIMWADTDDQLAQGSAEHLRGILQRHGNEADMFKILYTIPEQGISHWRERIARAGVAEWAHAVHECLEPTPLWKETGQNARVGNIEDVEFVHRPSPHRKHGSSSERNLHILESLDQAALTTSLKYQKWNELMLVGREVEGVKQAYEFLQDPKGGPVERAETFLRLSCTASSPKDKADLLTLCWRECPERREPLAGLAEIALRSGDLVRARAYINAMKGLPMPEKKAWTLQRRWWGWAAVQHEARILRIGDEHNKADAIELNHFIRNNGKISLLHATRGRPEQAVEARQRWYDRAENPDAIEHIFAIDIDDKESELLGMERHCVVVHQGLPQGPVSAWNTALLESHGEVVIQMSDDWEPPLHWDRLILERLGDLSQPKVLAVSDGARKDGLICMAICTREALKPKKSMYCADAHRTLPSRGNWLFHPAFFSMYSDNWFTEEMRARGIVINAPDLVFEHLHPAFGKAPTDGTYERSNNAIHYATGQGILRQLREGKEPFTWAHIPGWGDDSPQKLHARIMGDIMENISGGLCVEVGVAFGRGVASMATISKYFGCNFGVIGVDTFEGTPGEEYPKDLEQQCRDNLSRAGVNVTLLKQQSHIPPSLVPQPCYAYIDAAHDYESVKRDIAAWLPRIKEGGYIAGHDYVDSPDVKRAVDEAFGDRVQTLGECWFVKL